MKSITKFFISVTISLILFTAFLYFSFVNGFDYIETNFYSKKISDSIIENINDFSNVFDNLKNDSIKEFQELIKDPSINNIFSTNYSDEEIENRDELLKSLGNKVRGYDSIRIISNDGRSIQFSSRSSDIRSNSNNRVIYQNLNQIESEDYWDKVKLEGSEDNKLIYLEESNQLLYVLPFIDRYDQFRGIVEFYVSISGIRYILSNSGYISSSEEAFVISSGGILFNITQNQFITVKDRINNLWDTENPLPQAYLSISEDTGSYILFSKHVSGLGTIGRIIPAEDLKLTNYMKLLLLTTFFVILFFINFLILNVKQDKDVVLQNRIKRFQVKFLSEYIENKNQLDWNHWKDEINSRKKQVHERLIKDLGTYSKSNKDDIDKLINKGWDDIIDIISSKIPKPQKEESVKIDASQIEDILERVLAKGVRVKGFEAGVAVPTSVSSGRSLKSKRSTLDNNSDFSDMEPVEVEELDSLDDDSDFGDMEPVEVEELDSLDDDSDFGDMEPVEVEELDSLDDDSDFGDMEPVEVEELDSLDDDSDFGDMEPVEVEELDQ